MTFGIYLRRSPLLGKSGRGAARLRVRLAGLCRVGTEAYTALREAAEDREVELRLNITLRRQFTGSLGCYC